MQAPFALGAKQRLGSAAALVRTRLWLPFWGRNASAQTADQFVYMQAQLMRYKRLIDLTSPLLLIDLILLEPFLPFFFF